VYPTRTARFGAALVNSGFLRLKSEVYSQDDGPIEAGCPCVACQSCSRGYLHFLLKENEGLGAQYVTLHNLCYMMRLMRDMRQVWSD
jgi:tRNA-guanine family transglycosylase